MLFFCNKCGAEWSSTLGDNEIPEKCPYCKDGMVEMEQIGFFCNKCGDYVPELNELELEELEKEGSFVCSDCINKEMNINVEESVENILSGMLDEIDKSAWMLGLDPRIVIKDVIAPYFFTGDMKDRLFVELVDVVKEKRRVLGYKEE